MLVDRSLIFLVLVITEGIRQPLLQPASLGTIVPRGWILEELITQVRGLTGVLPKFWAPIANSSWIGGNSDNAGGLHESTPYWLNGAIPLVEHLNVAGVSDPALNDLESHVFSFMKTILLIQGLSKTGFLGPDTDPSDMWSTFPVLSALYQEYDAIVNGKRRMDEAFADDLKQSMLRHFAAMLSRLRNGVVLSDWSKARTADVIYILQLAMDQDFHHNSRIITDREMHDLMALLRYNGYDWKQEWFQNRQRFPVLPTRSYGYWNHGVNNAQAVKYGAVWSRMQEEPSEDSTYTANLSVEAWELLRRFHGQAASGSVSADEHLAGVMPTRGSELCLIVEAMYSLAISFGATMNPKVGDWIEDLALNGLFGALGEDMMTHPYLTFANSVRAVRNNSNPPWWSDGPDAAMYGLSPNYECCTSNMHQGLPKWLSGAYWIRHVTEKSVYVVCSQLVPSYFEGIPGGGSVKLDTKYPFDETGSLNFVVKSGNHSSLSLAIRKPSFVPREGVSFDKQGRNVCRVRNLSGDYWVVCKVQRGLQTSFTVRYAISLKVSTSNVMNGVTVKYGALSMVLYLKEKVKVVQRYEYGSRDEDITTDSSWNYALLIDQVDKWKVRFDTEALSRVGGPFRWHSLPPVIVEALGVIVHGWQLSGTGSGYPSDIPHSPLSCNKVGGNFTIEKILLVPFGSTRIRLSLLPWVTKTNLDECKGLFVKKRRE